MAPRVAVIILNWNGLEDSIQCLESLSRIKYDNFEIVVIDNHSDGPDAEVLRARYGDWIHLIENDRNWGFAEGNNIGVRFAIQNLGPRYILLLNNDTLVEPGFLSELVKVAEEDPLVGIVGSKIYLYGTSLIDSAGSLFNNVCIGTSRGNLERDEGQYDTQEEVAMVTACCCLIRKNALDETYLFEPSFFLYYEELDLNIRVRKLGYKVVYTPRSVVHHKYSQSVRKLSSQTLVTKRYYQCMNRAKVILTHYPTTLFLKNIHLISLSYAYYEYYFLRNASLRWLIRFNLDLARAAFKSLVSRPKNTVEESRRWVEWMNHYGLKDYVALLRTSNELWQRRLELSRPSNH